MAQNFWTAIWAWTVCFVVTIAVSLATSPKPDEELKGLVYGLTPHESDRNLRKSPPTQAPEVKAAAPATPAAAAEPAAETPMPLLPGAPR